MSKSLRRLALEELAERKQRERWRRDPMLWVQERLGEDPKSYDWSLWGDVYEKHKWDGDINPLAESWRTISNAYIESAEGRDPKYRIVGLEAATGTGKSYTIARIVYWFLDCFEDSLVITTGPTKEQLKSGLWSELSNFMGRIKKQHPKSNLYTMRLLMEDKAAQKRSVSQNIDFEDSYDGWMAMSHIAGAGADEVSAVKARGFHRKYMLIIMEEGSGMSWSVVNAFQNTCTGATNYIFIVGNPNNKTDSLNLLINQKNAKGFRVSAYDHPNIVMQKEVVPGAVTQISINDRKDTYGEGSGLYDAMVRGISPEQAFNSLMRAEWFDESIARDRILGELVPAMGVDVAASENGDNGALAMGEGANLDYLKEFSCPNATYLANNIMFSDDELAQRGITNYGLPCMRDLNISPEYIGIDGVGVGVATVEAFINADYNVCSLLGGQWEEIIPKDPFTEEPKWRFNNLRSQMYYELREDMRKGEIKINLTDKEQIISLKKELMAVNFEMKNDKMIAIESKNDIKKKLGGKSPNMADAVVYWNWIRKGHRADKRIDMPMIASRK